MNYFFLLITIGVVTIIMFGNSIGETKAQELINPNKVPTLNQISAVNTGNDSGNLIYSSQDLDIDKFTSLLMAQAATGSSNNTNNTAGLAIPVSSCNWI